MGPEWSFYIFTWTSIVRPTAAWKGGLASKNARPTCRQAGKMYKPERADIVRPPLLVAEKVAMYQGVAARRAAKPDAGVIYITLDFVWKKTPNLTLE